MFPTRERLPRLTAEEKEVSKDELENLRDTCLEACSGGGKKRVRKSKQAYADPDDLDAATLSDEEFLASSSGEEDLREAELKVGRAIGSYLQSQGVKNRSGGAEKAPAAGKKPYSSLSAEAHKDASKSAFERTMAVLKGLYGQAAPAAPAAPAARVRQTEAYRQPAPVFSLTRAGAKPAAPSKTPKHVAPGMVLNPSTKEVSYRHRNGRLSQRPCAL